MKVTGEHPFLAKDGWKVADLELFRQQRKDHGRYKEVEPLKLKINDVLITKDGELIVKTIEELQNRKSDETVYDFMTNGNQTYIANGFIVWDSH